MIIHNVSKNKINFSQRNNVIRPLSSCNTTSLTMASSYIPALWDMFTSSPEYKKYEQFEQPEDRFQQALLDWGLEPTNHYDLMKGYNRFVGKDIDHFSTDFSLDDLIDDLLNDKPWVGSGTFPGYPNQLKKSLGHIVCVVGIQFEEEPYSPDAVIIDDPYGDTMNNWRGSGNDVVIPWDLFARWFKPINNPLVKWAHRLENV